MFPGLEFHLKQLNDRVNVRLERYPERPYAARFTWTDLGQVDLLVPGMTGYVSLFLDSMVLNATLVKDPMSESQFAWLYTEIDEQQKSWQKLVESLREGDWIEDSKEFLVLMRAPNPSFTIGLNYGLYLKIECLSCVMSAECSLVKGGVAQYMDAMNKFELGEKKPSKINRISNRSIQVIEQALRHVHDDLVEQQKRDAKMSVEKKKGKK